MTKIKTLIVDDSVVFRTQVRRTLESLDGLEIEVVGVASNGKIAIDKLLTSAVDLVILDLEMPVMNGLETLRQIRKEEINVKTIVFSSASYNGAEVTLSALNFGASDFVAKPGGVDPVEVGPIEYLREIFFEKISSLFSNSKISEVGSSIEKENFPKVILELIRPDIIVIGSSTGGPTAVESVLSLVRPPISCPIIITQHMPPVFTKTFSERIERISGIHACEAVDGEYIKNGCIYVAPGDFHLSLKQEGVKVKTCLDQSEKIHSVRPAVDKLFDSAAKIYKAKCLGIVLTGMGNDGALGAVNIKKNGGAVLIQSRDSCVVFGMPGAVERAGAFDQELGLDEIASFINLKVSA